MAGYSGTALDKKLGIKPQFRVALPGLPADVRAELKAALRDCRIATDGRGPLDFAMIFVKSQADLKKDFSRYSKQLAPAGMLWVSWPRKVQASQATLPRMKCVRLDWKPAWWT